MKKETKFLTSFSNIKIRPVVSEEKDKYLSVASLEKLRKFIPNIDLKSNIDLLPVAFDACVVNRVNKNGDVIDASTAVKIAKNFINKPINVEHNRNNVIGCILNYGFSEFGTSQAIAEENLSETKKPFNITLGGVIWKIVNSELADKIEESNDPTSDHYMSVSASWELGFDEYNLVILEGGEKNIENSKIITDKSEVEKYQNKLKAFGGNGKFNNNQFIYRQVYGKVIPLGIGLTLNPAADVKGIAVVDNEESNNSENLASENNISQQEKIDVIKERIYMKISKIEEITNELLKEVQASSVVDFINEEIKKANDQFVAEKSEKENELNSAKEKLASITAEHTSIKKQVEELTQKLTSLEAEKFAKAQEESFNMRMAILDEEYDLSDEDRKVLASDIKDLNEEAFSAFQKKMSVLMKEKNKAAKKAAKEKMDKEDLKDKGADEDKEDKNGKMIKSSVASTEVSQEISTTQEVVEQAVDNGSKASTEIPNSTSAAEPSVKEKYAKAFGLEGFDIK
jgi:hypothetical protein